METIEFIISYLGSKATPEEKEQVRSLLKPHAAPPIEPNVILDRLLTNSKTKWMNGDGKLNLVKYVKDITGWGLKECKDWCDNNIFIIHRPNYVDTNNYINQ